ncbi:MAG: hypothetical protein WCJ24_02175 [Candidatus Saccharibacteria bacterium]
MSEQLQKGHERFSSPKGAEHETNQREAAPEHQPRHEKHDLEPVAELSKHAKEEAIAGKDLVSHEKTGPSESPLYVNRELKQQTWNRTMTRVRKHLSAPNKALSKAIHQPVVETVSRVGEKTVARPSGVLTGGICALIGSSFFLYMSKHYGFKYNYLLFAMFFVGGFFIGLIIELLGRIFLNKKTV